MKPMLTVAIREMRIGFRNPWAYSFLALFSLFSLALLLIHSSRVVEGYSSVTGTMLNLILYLLPLMTLLLGSFSLTAEKEEGGWQLLSAYPLGTPAFVLGKYAGIAAVLLVIVAFGYGLTSVVGQFTGKPFDVKTFTLFLAFSAGIVLLFLAVAAIVGTLAKNRWQALTYGVAIWFFTVIGWPTLLVAVLGLLPYPWIKPVLAALTLLNPAELVRLFIVVKLSGGSVLGPEYYEWIGWIRGTGGTLLFLLVAAVWIAGCLGAAVLFWERGRSRG
ncbi:ABC transporter permease [Paenibacillus sp. MZ04-78.2]|uniref:ABC transporter permease subunit n=1 Tax=Paenibacillus sp. MZ04-78.2 TaxID=2962034 RepID=UPI0020B8D816|nr:ABC transporter permease subunit [Paenibacillus sp. MZ04-78.2]MCP3773765.1 ABC transporter permease [Paenibacillus sp. MZ04-78.2]